MSENNNVAAAASAPVAEGFFLGLMGSEIKADDKKTVLGCLFAAQPKDGALVSYENVETLYPLNTVAAMECAKDCETSIWTFVDVTAPDGMVTRKLTEQKLTGIAAAVTIAKRLRVDEAFRARVRSGRTTEVELREHARSTVGFELPDNAKVRTVSEDAMLAVFGNPDATDEEKMEAMKALLLASGVKVNASTVEGV